MVSAAWIFQVIAPEVECTVTLPEFRAFAPPVPVLVPSALLLFITVPVLAFVSRRVRVAMLASGIAVPL